MCKSTRASKETLPIWIPVAGGVVELDVDRFLLVIQDN